MPDSLPSPISRREQYLNLIATGSGEIPESPISRIEMYLDYIARHGGGGQGTYNYEDLLGLPKIKGNVLKGNKVPSQLGFETVCSIASPNAESVSDFLDDIATILNNETEFNQLFVIINKKDILGEGSAVVLPAGTIIYATALMGSEAGEFTFSGVAFNTTSMALSKVTFAYVIETGASDLSISSYAELPTLPSEDGTYTLKCTVSSGTTTLSWVSDTP